MASRYIIMRSLVTLCILLSCVQLAPGEMSISGVGSGELLLNFTIKDTAPVFYGSYSYDLVGIHIPPIEDFSISSLDKTGYSYTLPGVYIPGKPNNFTVSASKVKNLNIGVRKEQGSYENASMAFTPERTRIWITSQIEADSRGAAVITNDMISPGGYQIKIFGDAAENVSRVNLTMTLIKKVIVNGNFDIGVNMTGFPSGNYKMSAKAINGSVRFDEINIEGLSL
ncbi:MAG: hypothetical protein ACE14P_10440 [Methanotrichaceae archaeon]